MPDPPDKNNPTTSSGGDICAETNNPDNLNEQNQLDDLEKTIAVELKKKEISHLKGHHSHEVHHSKTPTKIQKDDETEDPLKNIEKIHKKLEPTDKHSKLANHEKEADNHVLDTTLTPNPPPENFSAGGDVEINANDSRDTDINMADNNILVQPQETINSIFNNETVEAKFNSLADFMIEISNKFDLVNNECKTLKETCQSLQNENRTLNETCQSLQNENRTLNETCQSLKNECQILNNQNQTLKSQFAEFTLKFDQFDGGWNTLRSEVDNLKSKEVHSEVKRLTIEQLKKDVKHNREHCDKISKKAEEIASLAKLDWSQQAKENKQIVKAEILHVKDITNNLEKRVDGIEYKVGTISTKTDLASKEITYAKQEIKSAVRKVDTLPYKLTGKVVNNNHPKLKDIIKAQKQQREEKQANDKPKYRICIRLPETANRIRTNVIGAKIDSIAQKEVADIVGFTTKGNLYVNITDKEFADHAAEWVPKIDPTYSLLDTEPWYKATLLGVPESVTPEELKEALYNFNDYHIVLNNEPRMLNKNRYTQSFLVSFRNVQDFAKCADNLVIQYTKIRVRPYANRPKTPEELLKIRKEYRMLRNKSDKNENKKAQTGDSSDSDTPEESMDDSDIEEQPESTQKENQNNSNTSNDL